MSRNLLFSFLFVFVSAAQAANVAVIGPKRISQEEFNKRYEQNKQISGPNAAPSKEEVLSNIVNFEVAVQEALKQGLDKDPMLKDQVEILLYKALIQKQLKPQIDAQRISESEMRDYYQQSPLVKTRQIAFLVTPQMNAVDVAKIKAKAENVHKILSTGKRKFTDLVTEFSEAPDAKYGGLVDWAGRNSLVPEYYEAALALKNPGEHTKVVQSPYGFHIVQLEEVMPYATFQRGNREYKNFITRSLKDIKGRGIYEQYFADLQKKYAVKANVQGL